MRATLFVGMLNGALMVVSLPAGAQNAPASGATGAWADIVANVFEDRPMRADSGIVTLEAPYRAEDAAIVPMTIRTALPEGDPRTVRKVTLVIDENPSPVAASFEIGPRSGLTTIATRVRVNAYTPVHAVAELSDGSLHVAERFVKASGGCAAPAQKDPEEALANLGRMKLRQFEIEGDAARAEAQLMIRHPNNSGLQMDQVSRHYIPAYFVRDITVRQGDDLVLRMEGGISLSEDPNLRFDFAPEGGGTLSAEVIDTEDKVFSGAWPVEVRAGS